MTAVQAAARQHGIVVIGAGQAGGRAAEALRAEGFAGSLTLIGDEPVRPYERPSLSKEMLIDLEQEYIAWLHNSEFLARQDIAFECGVKALRIDRAGRTVQLSDGREIGYGALVIATGRRPRRLDIAGADSPQCLYLRSLADSRSLREQLRPGRRLLVVGAGFIGLEVAAAAIQRGCRVSVVEASDVPIARVAPAELGARLREEHERRGVEFRFHTQVSRFERDGGLLRAVTQAGDTIETDLAVIGIGAVPNSELAADAGLAVHGGIVTDCYGTTDDPHIFAAGDVALHFNTLVGRHVALESWQNAQNGAIAVARNLARVGPMKPYADVPWFWSDQYGLNLQIFGLLNPGASNIVKSRPDGSMLYFQVAEGRLVQAAGINASRDLRPAKDLIAAALPVRVEELADPAVSVSAIARQAKFQDLSA
jgi:NADPH-dependent 2,4-dienoyl-CoA reductase/sulfur reductase-like enzyme